MKIAFIGGGNMGRAMLSAILKRELCTPEAIFVSDINKVCCQSLEQELCVYAASDNKQIAAKGDVVILAVKPQNLPEVMSELKGQLKSGQLVLSIMAGVRIDTLRNGLSHSSLVRAMPNTPAQISEGMTVWTATPEVTEEQKDRAASILGVMGKEIFVPDEKYLDMATAVSGSGPAYVFLFIESLIDAAVHIGLPRNMAQELAVQTVLGSAQFVQESGKLPAELRAMVTSPGGTTAEAVFQLEKGAFTGLIAQAVTAAYEKAKKLGG